MEKTLLPHYLLNVETTVSGDVAAFTKDPNIARSVYHILRASPWRYRGRKYGYTSVRGGRVYWVRPHLVNDRNIYEILPRSITARRQRQKKERKIAELPASSTVTMKTVDPLKVQQYLNEIVESIVQRIETSGKGLSIKLDIEESEVRHAMKIEMKNSTDDREGPKERALSSRTAMRGRRIRRLLSS